MKTFMMSLLVLFSTEVYADQVDCRAAERNYQAQIDTLKRDCARTSECRADNLSWDPCAKPVVHSDSTLSPLMTAALNDLSRICPRPARPCPALTAKPICIDKICENSADLGTKNDLKIVIQFMQNSKPLANQKVNLIADTGIRCVTAPCDSSREVESFVTDQDGKIYITVGKIMSLINGSSNPNVIHQHVGPDGYALTIENVGYHGVDFSALLVDTHKINIFSF